MVGRFRLGRYSLHSCRANRTHRVEFCNEGRVILSKFTDRIDMRFQYVSSAATNIAKTIARERKRLAEEKAKREAEGEAISVEQSVKLRMLKGATK